jgi:hypothetical protein
VPQLLPKKLQLGEHVDFSPSLQWPAPVTTHAVEPDRGPVLVTIEYKTNPNERGAFLNALASASSGRRRDGGEEIARHLLNSGEHEVNSPATSEIAQEQHGDDHFRMSVQ